MQYFKLVTSDRESRWINLAQVSRVTLAPSESARGGPVLAIFFADACPDRKLEVHGTTPENCQAIEKLTQALDALAGQRAPARRSGERSKR